MIYHHDDPVREALVNAAGRERPKYGRKPGLIRKPGSGSIFVGPRGKFIAQLRGEYIGSFPTWELAEDALAEADARQRQK